MKNSSHSYTRERKARRFPLDRSDEPFVEFALDDGSVWQLSLLELSAGGMAFCLDEGRAAFPAETRIDKATIRVGASHVEGSLHIVHATPTPGIGTVCGAEFSPLTEEGERTLGLLLDRLEKRTEWNITLVARDRK